MFEVQISHGCRHCGQPTTQLVALQLQGLELWQGAQVWDAAVEALRGGGGC